MRTRPATLSPAGPRDTSPTGPTWCVLYMYGMYIYMHNNVCIYFSVHACTVYTCICIFVFLLNMSSLFVCVSDQ